jgi:hypothetical protein
MYGKRTLLDSRLDNARQYPVAAKAKWGQKRDKPDLITAKLSALHFYQLAMPVPRAPEGSFDPEAVLPYTGPSVAGECSSDNRHSCHTADGSEPTCKLPC